MPRGHSARRLTAAAIGYGRGLMGTGSGDRPLWTATVVLAVAIGLTVGIGGFTFVYARGASYFTNAIRRPAPTVTSCAITSRAGSPAAIAPSQSATTATCRTTSSASTPRRPFNGFWHSFAFTMGGATDAVALRDGRAAATKR